MPDRPLLHLVVPQWGGTGIHQTFGHRVPPMSLLVLAAHARRVGWDVEIFDLNYERSALDSPDWHGERPLLRRGRRRSGKPDLAALTWVTSPTSSSWTPGGGPRVHGRAQ